MEQRSRKFAAPMLRFRLLICARHALQCIFISNYVPQRSQYLSSLLLFVVSHSTGAAQSLQKDPRNPSSSCWLDIAHTPSRRNTLITSRGECCRGGGGGVTRGMGSNIGVSGRLRSRFWCRFTPALVIRSKLPFSGCASHQRVVLSFSEEEILVSHLDC